MDTCDDKNQNEKNVLSYRVDIFNSSTYERVLLQFTTYNSFLTVEALPRIQLYCRVFAVTSAGVSNFSEASDHPEIPLLRDASVTLFSNITGAKVVARVRFILNSTLVQNDQMLPA
jgi:hypothetical protein